MTSTSTLEPPATCPIDPQAREAWLAKAHERGEQPPHPLPKPATIPHPTPSTSIFSFRFPAPYDARIRQAQKTATAHTHGKPHSLSQQREVSTIPRASLVDAQTTPNPSSRPSNHEHESGADERTGNWIYPSEKMFFEAMRRKNFDPQATDMSTIVPIHNAVNERAWKEIKLWEEKFGWSQRMNVRCSGPRLLSFSGDSKKLSLRARWNMLWGYTAPFDRHDWIIERCSGEPGVEYIIDFYEGKAGQGLQQQGRMLNFYLDVRPKLNTWEGWKMRIANMTGSW